MNQLKIIIIAIWTVTLLDSQAIAQKSDQVNLVSIINKAYELGKLPKLLLQTPDTLFRHEISTDYIAIQATKKNNLERYHPTTFGKVIIEVWEGEDLFLHNTQVWLAPGKFKITQGRATLDYRTKYLSQNPAIKCYAGSIVALQVDDEWTIKKSRYKECKCNLTIEDTFK